MRVKSCEASDNRNRPIQLSDSDGCVLRPKMVSKYMKMRSTDPRATVVTYAFFHAFKFPDSMAVHIKCKVEICRYGCPDHCQSSGNYLVREQEVSSNLNNYQPNQNRRVFPPPPPPPPPQSAPQIQFQTDPRNSKLGLGNNPLGGIYAPKPPQLPLPAALVSNKEPRLARENSELMYEHVGTGKTADAGLANFLGLKFPEIGLPKLPGLPSIFGGEKKKKLSPRPQAKKDGDRLTLGYTNDEDLDVSSIFYLLLLDISHFV